MGKRPGKEFYMNKKKVKATVATMAMVGVLAAGGIMAYFTDADTATNTFSLGKVSLDLQEPNWEPPQNITPNQEITKDPQVKNDGVNEEFVFLTVDVPYANIVTANADGTKNAAADTELFSYTVNAGWKELGAAQKDTAKGVVRHTYVYGTDTACTALAKDAVTPALFSSVTFCNAVEDQNLETSTKEILLNAYGIQTTDINGGTTVPAEVWEVIQNQAPSTDVAGNEDANTDIKG